MGVYINMEMPERCWDCDLCYDKFYCKRLEICLLGEQDKKCRPKEFDPADDRLPNCPLVPVPPHGDLIDYNFCIENYELLHDDDWNPVYAVRMRDINNAPTIVPAEEDDNPICTKASPASRGIYKKAEEATDV